MNFLLCVLWYKIKKVLTHSWHSGKVWKGGHMEVDRNEMWAPFHEIKKCLTSELCTIYLTKSCLLLIKKSYLVISPKYKRNKKRSKHVSLYWDFMTHSSSPFSTNTFAPYGNKAWLKFVSFAENTHTHTQNLEHNLD